MYFTYTNLYSTRAYSLLYTKSYYNLCCSRTCSAAAKRESNVRKSKQELVNLWSLAAFRSPQVDGQLALPAAASVITYRFPHTVVIDVLTTGNVLTISILIRLRLTTNKSFDQRTCVRGRGRLQQCLHSNIPAVFVRLCLQQNFNLQSPCYFHTSLSATPCLFFRMNFSRRHIVTT